MKPLKEGEKSSQQPRAQCLDGAQGDRECKPVEMPFSLMLKHQVSFASEIS